MSKLENALVMISNALSFVDILDVDKLLFVLKKDLSDIQFSNSFVFSFASENYGERLSFFVYEMIKSLENKDFQRIEYLNSLLNNYNYYWDSKDKIRIYDKKL